MKYFPKHGLGDKVSAILEMLDRVEPRLGDSESLGPMMSKPLRVSLQAFIKFIDRNLNEYAYFRISKILADEVIKALQEIHHGEAEAGIITYGGSESNLTSLYVMREMGYHYAVVPMNVHESVVKAARILGIKLFFSKVDSRNKADINDLAAKVKQLIRGGRRVFVVLTAGNTETGGIDDVEEFYKEIDSVPIVVDAAFGGLIAPFVHNVLDVPRYDFTIPSVACIGIDGHKAGLTPIPSGALIFRSNDLLHYVSFNSKYFSSQYKQVSLLWTRTAASAAALWASINYLGFDGFRNNALSMIRNAKFLYERLLDLGFKAVEPELPVVCFALSCSQEANEKLLMKLLRRGWHVYRCPFLNGLKVTVMPHVTRGVLEDFVEDLRAIIRDLEG